MYDSGRHQILIYSKLILTVNIGFLILTVTYTWKLERLNGHGFQVTSLSENGCGS